MYILSIDIGIKNFAYCLIEYTNNDYYIKKWDVINIGLNKKCFYKNCKNNVKYTKNNIFYCFKHSNLSNLKKPNKNNNYEVKSKETLEKLNKYCKTNKIDISNCKNKNEVLDLLKEYYENNYLDVVKNNNCNSMSLIDIGKNIMILFDDIFKNDKIDIVLIENQISPIATRMKTLQGMVCQYFIMREIENIQFISSSNKLKYFIVKKLNYKEKKNKGVEVVREFLKLTNLNHWNKYFNENSKKDDLADSFLQGLWYLINNKYIKYI